MCCGTEREVSVFCPLDCEYLLEARRHEKFEQPAMDHLPNKDIEVSEEFLERNSGLVDALSRWLLESALRTPGAVDQDIRQALDAMVRTYRTRVSGLLYETRPENPVAGAIQQYVSARVEEARQAEARQRGLSTVRDADVLGALVFVHRLASYWDNKRPRGRSFTSTLLERYGSSGALQASAQTLIVP